MPRALDGARHVDVEHAPVAVRGHFQERAAHHDASVVDQDIQLAEAADGFRDERARIGILGHVTADGESLGAQDLRLGHHLVGLARAREVIHRDPRAFLGVGERDGASEAAAGARDEGNATLEPSAPH